MVPKCDACGLRDLLGAACSATHGMAAGTAAVSDGVERTSSARHREDVERHPKVDAIARRCFEWRSGFAHQTASTSTIEIAG